MKILLASTTFHPVTHGPAKFAHFLLQVNELYPEHEVRILTEGISSPVKNKIYKITTHYPRPLGAFWVFFDNLTYYKKIKTIREEYPFDVLVFNNVVQALWSKWHLPQHIKVIGMLNDDDYLSTSIRQFRLDKMWFINFHRKFLEGFAARALDGVITNSHYLKNQVKKVYQLNEPPVRQLYKAIDLENIPFRSQRSIDLNRKIKVLFVKADYPRGGLKILAEALQLLSDFQFELCIMGPKKEHQPLISSYVINAENVTPVFKGPSGQKEVYQALQKQDIFCVPSLREGLGVANIEALAAGIPVVSTTAGGIPEVLDQGRNGWLCPPGEVEALAEQIRQCLTQVDLRQTKSRRGRAFVEQHFNHQQMLEHFIQLLKNTDA